MVQPYAPLVDLRLLRTTFFSKSVAYALSYEYKVERRSLSALHPDAIVLRLASEAPSAVAAPPDGTAGPAPRLTAAGEVFTVLGDARVAGLDGLGHETPSGFRVCSVDETITLRWRRPKSGGPAEAVPATIEGRLVLEAPLDPARTDREPVRICVTYDGSIEMDAPASWEHVAAGGPLQGRAYLATFIEVSLPEYHWLTENASIAYGTWGMKGADAEASFDVYLTT